MKNILSQYYSGILQQVRGNVDCIHTLFEHNGLKGEGNERVLAELLRRFLPSAYTIGSGIVIDRNGGTSRQCDIIIYDCERYPHLLSMGAISLFPVDIVYGVIEVKTTLSSGVAKEAIENISSVRSLNYKREKVIYTTNNGFSAVDTSPPIGCVFSYNTDTKNFKTFKNWFLLGNSIKTRLLPTLVCSLDQGILKFETSVPENGERQKGFATLWCDDEGNAPDVSDLNCSRVLREGRLYPVKGVNGRRFAIDEAKSLLYFLMMLTKFISSKKLIFGVSFLEEYLQGSMCRTLEV